MDSTTVENNEFNNDTSPEGTVERGSLIQQVLGKQLSIGRSPIIDTPLMKSLPVTNEFVDNRNFFKRRFRIASGNFATNDAAQGASPFLKYYDLFNFINQTSPFINHMRGYQAVKIKGRVIVQWNTSPYMFGRYVLSIMNNMGPVHTTANFNSDVMVHGNTLSNRTTLPNVELNLSKGSMVEMPFNIKAPTGYYQHMTTSTNLAFVPCAAILSCIQTLQIGSGTGVTTASYETYIEIDDFSTVGTGYFQGDIQEDEISKKPVSNALKKVSKQLNVLGRVPFLSSFTQAGSYLTDILADSAKVWGLSSPSLAATEITKVSRSRFDNFNTIDTARPLTNYNTVASNHALVAPVTENDIDEMSISYLCSKKTWLANISWPKASANNTSLYSTNVWPISVSTVYNGHTVNTGPFIKYLSNFFGYWRGSIIFTLKINKTQFHAGRLLVLLEPPFSGYDGSAATPDSTNQQYFDKFIWDITAQDEVSFCIPHNNLQDWLCCNATDISQANGVFRVIVLDQLVSPDSVPSDISISLYQSAGEDFMFCFPNSHTNIKPVSTADTQGLMEEAELGCVTLGAPSSSGIDAIKLSSGEICKSIRNLIKVPTYNQPVISMSATNYDQRDITPFVVDITTYGAASTNTVNSDVFSCMTLMYGAYRGSVNYYIWSHNYNSTGTVNTSITSGVTTGTVVNGPDNQNTSGALSVTYNNFIGGAAFIGASNTNNATGVFVAAQQPQVFLTIEQGSQITFPYVNTVPYSSVLGSCSNPTYDANTSPFRYPLGKNWPAGRLEILFGTPSTRCTISNPNLTGQNHDWYFRSAGDDYTLHQALTPPAWN